jgi:lipopolysaccharide/colanic/teichoic acid biosynthesis glycosyltransferase
VSGTEAGLTPQRATRRGLPRGVEILFSLGGLVVTLPFLLVACLAIVLDSRGSPFFLQERVGRGGRPFRLWKLRTMKRGGGPKVTAAGDSRVTRVGRVLRQWKLDELPQLWNVLVGDMSFVGPRPEVPALVNGPDELWKRVLAVRPGITDPVSLALKDEEALLGSFKGDHEVFYREVLQPFKLRGYVDYLEKRTTLTDLGVILSTILVAAHFKRVPSVTLAQLESRESRERRHA